jgi:hypothetical protein
MSRVTIDLPDPPINAPPMEYWIDDYLESLRPTLKEAFQDAFRQWLEQNHTKATARNPFDLSFEEFEKLSEVEQSELRWQAFSLNKPWIDEQLQKHDAEWIVVVGGKVEKFSSTLDDLPTKSEIRKLGRGNGMTPFLFIREPLIEESASVFNAHSQWVGLKKSDFYPTIKMAISPLNNDEHDLESTCDWLTADLDTGSPASMVRETDITRMGINLDNEEETWAVHLGQRYRYVTPQVQIAIQSESQGLKIGVFRPRVVYDWATGPFVQINPNRTALVGRNLLLQLGIDILLKGTERKTIIV